MTDTALDTLWKHVLDHWEDDKAHGAFLDHCQRSDQLVEAAVRYRGMKGDRVRGPVAEKRLAAVALLALAKLETTRSSERRSPQRAAWILVLFFVLASTLMLAYVSSTR